MRSGQREYYERLQSFRGFGILAVAFFHCQGISAELPMRAAPGKGVGNLQVFADYVSLAVLNGHAALMAFFVLSGFVLTLSLRRGPQRAIPAGSAFLTARVFRIIPANALAVAVAVAIAAVVGAAPQARVAPPWQWSQIATNVALVNNSINPVTWTLTVELLAAPFIVAMYLVTRRWGLKPLICATTAAIILSFGPKWIGYRPLGRNLFAFFAGMLVAEAGPALTHGMTRQSAARICIIALALWFPARAVLGRWSHFASVAESLAAAIMIVLIAYGPRLRAYRLFELRPLLWLGEISYSFYLYHPMLMVLFSFPSSGAAFVWLGGWAPLGSLLVAWLVTTAVAILAGWLSYETAERLGIRVGRPVIQWLAYAPIGATVGFGRGGRK